MSCFKQEFQEFIFSKINCSNYYEFLNDWNTQFTINLEQIQKNVISEITPNILKEDKLTDNFQENSHIKEFIKSVDDIIENNESNSKINDSNEFKLLKEEDDIVPDLLSDDDSDSKSDSSNNDIEFTHSINNGQILVNSTKKFITKKITKLIKSNGGFWLKKKNIWTFPLSSRSFVENTLHSKNIAQDKDKVIITPKPDDPRYGISIIYDKSGNIGIWDQNIKGWVFTRLHI